VHLDSLHGKRETAESLSYKTKAIRVLNELLRDPSQATSDETISAVLLLGNILVRISIRETYYDASLILDQSIIGEQDEVATHLSGLQKMVNLRGGISKFSIDGCFLHMLCT
jgi:hypothetical protein